ncbi:MAG: hypothetical protein ABSC01_12245 [Verrucomicrobiota bacterium]
MFNRMSRGSNKKAAPGKAPGVRSSASVSPAVEMPGVADSRLPEPASRPAGLNDRWMVPGVCIFLAAITFAVFGQTLHHGFVSYDDGLYVYENAQVARGLTLNGIAQAFTRGSFDNWDPLTAISHMLDCQCYGLNAGGHHLTNILLHAATAILLFLVLRRMTGALWRSAFVAAVFAIHPLRVESVAWVSERKDVLSGLFFMLTITGPLWTCGAPVYTGSDVQADAGNVAVRIAVAGLLAAESLYPAGACRWWRRAG